MGQLGGLEPPTSGSTMRILAYSHVPSLPFFGLNLGVFRAHSAPLSLVVLHRANGYGAKMSANSPTDGSGPEAGIPWTSRRVAIRDWLNQIAVPLAETYGGTVELLVAPTH